MDHFLRRHRRRRLLHRLAAHQVRTRRPLPWQPRRRQPRPERQQLQDERELVKNLAGPEGRFSIAPLFSNDLKKCEFSPEVPETILRNQNFKIGHIL